MQSKGRVLVAMSGGIDSTVTAMMMKEQGYDVVGITMKTWDYANSGGSKKETGCCSLDSINDARQVSLDMGFPHYIVDIREEFGSYVIDNFVDEYMSGRTPNPCVLCNTHIKWSALLKRADMLGCNYIATGHYAKIKDNNGRYFISKSADAWKDQSYVLWGLSQECMSRSLFPLGNMTKDEVRKYALDSGYEELSKKAESFEICFVPDNDYRGFLRRKIPSLDVELAGGKFVDKEGNVLGQHEGYPFYTIGQRKGLGIALGEPMYVTKLVPETNTVVLGRSKELIKNGMVVGGLVWMKRDALKPGEEMECRVKIRYKSTPVMCALKGKDDGRIEVSFHAEVKGVAPGQSAVFYDEDDVVCGGIIGRG